ncbi:hypothetical protein Csal_1381 [Chromohalobacter israelensis DSM 3043]|uniref:Uncharacterized protein n=1 Tax=Chromohalobacter israelensis (strain ATCC BAA-138 / DSM 3043 / CIP 106854 / NCIMB 13768 / 1H11) TaxID=290398 RepID=Q1QXS2_CHRI1|nr:hypothetical protein Csal_1381 [Chromohalobacter salexigens DSM 3043]
MVGVVGCVVTKEGSVVEIFATVVTGVSVFVLGRLIEQFVIKPIHDFREALGQLSYFLLSNQASLTNCNATDDMSNSLKRMGGINIAKMESIPFYGSWELLRFVPKAEDVTEASMLLNLMANDVLHGKNQTHMPSVRIPERVCDSLSKIGEKLGIKTTYVDLPSAPVVRPSAFNR